jgi:energy-coupling factor transporter ATP-binding protein EcfA2
MLRLESVTYRHAGATRPSLVEVDLELGEGEVVGVVGANGSGKSTLCLVLTGLAPRVAGGTLTGRVLVDEDDLASLKMHEISARVAIGFDDPWTQLSGVTRTVYEEVAFGAANLGTPLPELTARVGAALQALAIEHLADRDPAHLSGGQQQLVAIAGLLAIGAPYVVLDEPTAQLDPAGTGLVADALRELATQGTGVVVCEHKTELLERLCDRVVVLDEGRVALDGPASAVLSDPSLPSLGVAPPPRIAITSRLRAAGVRIPGALAEHLASPA